MALDLAGVAVSTGAACAAGAVEPSHVLRAMGLPQARVQGSLRFSLGRGTTAADVDDAVAAVDAALSLQAQRGAQAADDSRGHLLLGVVRGAHQRARLDVAEAERLREGADLGELRGRVVAHAAAGA